MYIKTTTIIALLHGLLLSACSTFVPVEYNPEKLAYAALDDQGNPTLLCFDTISPNHCIHGNAEMLKKYSFKERILSQKYILILASPNQIDCRLESPRDCRVYFEHIYVDVTFDPDEIKNLKKQLKDTEI